MPRLILFNKPFGVLCQFSDDGSGKPTLAQYIKVPAVYPAGRLDTDSEGLLLLTDDGQLQARIADPKFKLAKTYLVQVEGVPDAAALEALRHGVTLKDGKTRPAEAEAIPAPELWPRGSPIRVRQSVHDSWIKLTLRGHSSGAGMASASAGRVLPSLSVTPWRKASSAAASGTPSTCTR